MSGFNWVCPHCERAQTVTPTRRKSNNSKIDLDNTAEMDGYEDGALGYSLLSIACSNPECRKLTMRFQVGEVVYNNGYRMVRPDVFDKLIYPSASYKNFPDYIPAAILEDYREACLIRDLSPKASATLSRRCIQGMIRDFAGIAKAG